MRFGATGKKQRHLTRTDDPAELGDFWTFVALDPDTKLIPVYRVGKRDGATANAFVEDLASRRTENLKAAVALHFAYYNFVRIHRTLRVTPAMAAGVTSQLWTVAQLAALRAN